MSKLSTKLHIYYTCQTRLFAEDLLDINQL